MREHLTRVGLRRDRRGWGLALVFLAGVSHLALAAAGAQEQVGQLAVTGAVTVNGKPAATGEIVAAGSEVQTTKGASAVVNLGVLGRVEALPSTTLKLRYDQVRTPHNFASVAIALGDGSVRVTIFNIESGMTVVRPTSRTQQNVFTVEANCGSTLVSVTKGKVELRSGDTVKQIAEGGQGTVGQPRAGCTPKRAP
jgi:hypothetical protein